MMEITKSTLESAQRASQKFATGEEFREIEEAPGLFISRSGTVMPKEYVTIFSFVENGQEFDIHTKV